MNSLEGQEANESSHTLCEKVVRAGIAVYIAGLGLALGTAVANELLHFSDNTAKAVEISASTTALLGGAVAGAVILTESLDQI